jgi:rubrerythrin
MTQKAVKRSEKSKAYKMIAVSPETYLRLLELGRMGDTMDGVINKLMQQRLKVQGPRTYECSECGSIIGTMVDPTGFQCPGCKKAPKEWRKWD